MRGWRGTDSGPRLVGAAQDPLLAIAYTVLPKRRNSAALDNLGVVSVALSSAEEPPAR
jgi:hypothetical protein